MNVPRDALNDAMVRLSRGERAAQRAVFAGVWPLMRAFCARVLGDDASAEDAAQRALIQLFRQATAFDPAKDVRAWSFELARWECRTELQRRNRSKEQLGAEGTSLETAPSSENPHGAMEAEEAKRLLQSALETMRPADREVIERWLGPDAAEFAAADANERKRKQRAIERLRAAWRTLHGND